MIEYVPLDCLVLVRFVCSIHCLILVGSDLHTLAGVHWLVCGCLYGIGEVCFLSVCCDKFLFS